MVYTSSNTRAMSKSLQITNKQHQEQQKKKPQPHHSNVNHYYQFQQQQQHHRSSGTASAVSASHNGGIYMSSLYNDRSIDHRTKTNYASTGNNYGDESEV